MEEKTVFDQFSKNYNPVHDQHLPPGITHEQFFIQKLNWVKDLLKTLHPLHEKNLLDFGCNQGELTTALAFTLPLQIYGIDESTSALETAKTRFLANHSKGKAPVYFQNLNELESTVSFDVACIFNVLHHIEPESRVPVLKQLAKKMKPGSTLLIWEHNRWNPLTRYLVKICPFDEGVHLVAATRLKKILEQNDFKIILFEYVNCFPPKLHSFFLIAWIEKLLSFLPFGAQYRIKAIKK